MDSARPAAAWSRDFCPRHASYLWLLPSLVCFVIGGAALLLEIVALVFGHGLDFPFPVIAVFGLFSLVVGWGFFYSWRSAERQRVICGPEGFRLETGSRRKVSRTATYRWSEVTATTCRVEDHEMEEHTVYYQTFHITTADGEDICFDDDFHDFMEIIGIFNVMASHLPYVWTPCPRGQAQECVPGSPGETHPLNRHAEWKCAPRPAGS